MTPTVVTISGQSAVVGREVGADAAASVHQATAEQLASMLAPPEMIKGQMAGIVAAESESLRNNAEFATLEKSHPGAIDAVAFAVAIELRQYGLARLPVLWKRLGAIYAAALTDVELRHATDFYRSAPGAWLLDQIRANSDTTRLNKERVASGRDVTTNDLQSSTDAAKQTFAERMTPEIHDAIAAFTYSPVGSKLRELKPQLRQVQVDWSNERSPELASRLKTVIAETITKFSEATPKEARQ